MLGLFRLIELALFAAAMWYGLKLVRRLNAAERALRRRATSDAEARSAGSASAQDLVACPQCGTYMSPDASKSCGRARCPYGKA